MATPVADPLGVDAGARRFRLTSGRLALLTLFALGLGWRLLRYGLQFPIWGDEAYVCLNFVDQTYFACTAGLKYAVVVPVFFLWGELTAFQWLGGSELALRLLPMLVGLVALPLFWRLARQVLSPRGSILALGFLAVSYYPVRHCCEVKPYALDLVVSILLSTLAAAWLRRPERRGPLVLLCVLLPFLLGFSNPAVFVAGGVSVALLPVVWRQPYKIKVLWVAYNVTLVVSFLGYLQLNMQMQPPSNIEFLQTHWGHAFPPHELRDLPGWLLDTHTSNMMAYPMGGKNGGSTLTFVLVLAGLWHFARVRRWSLLLLWTVPFGLTFVAAWMHRYPYGDSARLCQHLAPATCLLAAAGCAQLIEATCRTLRSQKIALTCTCGVLALVGVGGIARDLLHPFKTTGDAEGRRIAQHIADEAGPGCPVVLLAEWQGTQPEFIWYLQRNHQRIIWQADADWHALEREPRLVCVRIGHHRAPTATPALPLPDSQCVWQMAGHEVYARPLEQRPVIMEYIDVVRWQRR